MYSTGRLQNEYEFDDFNKSQSAKIVSIRKKRLEREKQKKRAKTTLINTVKSLLLVFIFVAMLSMIIFKNSLVSEAKYNIFNLKSEIKSLNTQIEELNADIEQKTELKAVEKIAIEELKMQYPTKAQIVYVDSTVQYALEDKQSVIPMASEIVKEEPSLFKDIVAALFRANK
ncbi:FtsB/FtsL family cell division protein [Fusibacter ferrireducens]|uniref:Cell division protein FtsL n=1 Tax=Fusibacter ferrireducens TaxID=2785058 RepID=A0ABR9ZMG8_9FIRM|nr:cell division protein FtsL [Fusibacter ferrireducens]MBF4691599.1 cell division protein FtsL [Fusibacter ferrireducens]